MSRFTAMPAPALCVGSLKAGEPWVLCLQCVGVSMPRSDGVRTSAMARFCGCVWKSEINPVLQRCLYLNWSNGGFCQFECCRR